MLNSMAMSILFLLFSLSEINLSFTFYSVRLVHGPTLKSPVSFFFVHVYFLQPAYSWCACIEASSQSLLCTRAYKSPISVVFVCVHWSLQLMFSFYTCIEVSSQSLLYTRAYKSPISVVFVCVHWSLQTAYFFLYVRWSPQSAFSLHSSIDVSSQCSFWNAQLTRYIRNSNFHLSLSCDRM